MQISRVLGATSALICSAAMLAPSTAAAQQAQTSRPDPYSWLLDVNYSQAARARTGAGCGEVYNDGRSQSTTDTCSTDRRTQAWHVSGGLIFRQVIGFRVGYQDYGKITKREEGQADFVFVPAGSPAPPLAINTVISERDEFGRARGMTLTGLARAPIGRFVPFAEFGLWRWSAQATARTGFVASSGGVVIDSGSFEDRQSYSSWDPILGGGAEVRLNEMLGVSTGVRFVRLKSKPGTIDERFTTYFAGVTIGR
jgi:OmpA-like transmembrane domain